MITGRVFIATSLDGFIARKDGDIAWLLERDDPAEDHGYDAFIEKIDIILMGRGTFEKMRDERPWFYTRPVLVLSASLKDQDIPADLTGKVRVSDKSPEQVMEMLEVEGHRRVYVDGGKVIQSFLRGADRRHDHHAGPDTAWRGAHSVRSDRLGHTARAPAHEKLRLRSRPVTLPDRHMTRPRGRPHRDKAPASRDQILTAALELLDTGGIEAFTMRALADRLQVNPMTIYHHFGDRDGLIDALSEHVYAEVSAPASGTFHDRIRSLLNAYHDRVISHPGLTLLIFRQPAVFPRQAQRITDDIDQLLVEAGLPSERSHHWLNILVDFTHGAAIAAAMGDRSNTALESAKDDYDKTLTELLNGIEN